MRRLVLVAFVLVVAAAAARLGGLEEVRAARDTIAPAHATSGLELLVIEAPNCAYCRIFRRDVAPAYLASKRASDVPMRFLDVNDVNERMLGLISPISSVPTVVLIGEGREIGRIAGYTGPEAFFHLVGHLIGRTR